MTPRLAALVNEGRRLLEEVGSLQATASATTARANGAVFMTVSE
jgi:hypothetical protein